MFKNTFQSGFLSILYSLGTKPLQIWDKEVVNGHIKRPQDEDIQSNVLEIIGTNVQSTYITCPADPSATLGIKLPFLAIIVKNLKKYFTFEIQVLDDKNVRRRFRASNFQWVKETGRHEKLCEKLLKQKKRHNLPTFIRPKVLKLCGVASILDGQPFEVRLKSCYMFSGVAATICAPSWCSGILEWQQASENCCRKT